MRQLDLFSALQSITEGIDTEFKSARGGMPGSFWESYTAMANTQGGTVVLGVAEKPSGLVCGRSSHPKTESGYFPLRIKHLASHVSDAMVAGALLGGVFLDFVAYHT